MKSFKDSKGRTWDIELSVAVVKRIRKMVGVDLLALDVKDQDGVPSLTKLAGDIITTCDVIYAVVFPQAEVAQVTDEEFGSSLGGSVIEAARTAFFESLIDFFRQLGRLDLVTAIQKTEELIKIVVNRRHRQVESLDPEKFVDEKLTSGNSSTSTPASLA